MPPSDSFSMPGETMAVSVPTSIFVNSDRSAKNAINPSEIMAGSEDYHYSFLILQKNQKKINT